MAAMIMVMAMMMAMGTSVAMQMGLLLHCVLLGLRCDLADAEGVLLSGSSDLGTGYRFRRVCLPGVQILQYSVQFAHHGALVEPLLAPDVSELGEKSQFPRCRRSVVRYTLAAW